MNTKKTYKRLTPDEKIAIIEKVLNGERVSKICLENGISRTIFYRWLKEYKKESRIKNPELKIKGLEAKTAKGKKHWRKLKLNQEREVVRLWLNNPTFSLRKIAKETKISIGGVWNIINKYKVIVSKSATKKIKRYTKKSYKTFTSNEKIDFIKRHENGEHIAKIARAAGVSRTIFYRWIKQYKNSINPDLALQIKRPSGENHWRYIPGVKNLILDIVFKNPELSLSQIAFLIKQKKQYVSRSGLYYMLKRMNLASYDDRLAYITSTRSAARSRHYYYDLPRFAALSFVAIFGIFSVLYSLNLKLKPTITTQIPFVSIAPTKDVDKEKSFDSVQSKPPPKAISNASKQDFKWGALAMNSPKSSYFTQDDVSLGFGVVDHQGVTICDAQLSLEVLDPSTGIAIVNKNSQSGSITQSGECSIRSVTNTADYKADIGSFKKEGAYDVRVLASTYDGKKEFEGKLIVENDPAFEITRNSFPTRVYPVSAYPVEITIKAQEDFKGQISEILPDGITASKISGVGVLFKNLNKDERSIHWQVDFRKGKTYNLSYSLNFPQVYPEYYEIGPLRFVDKLRNKLVYQEPRYWQVVADSLEE